MRQSRITQHLCQNKIQRISEPDGCIQRVMQTSGDLNYPTEAGAAEGPLRCRYARKSLRGPGGGVILTQSGGARASPGPTLAALVGTVRRRLARKGDRRWLPNTPHAPRETPQDERPKAAIHTSSGIGGSGKGV